MATYLNIPPLPGAAFHVLLEQAHHEQGVVPHVANQSHLLERVVLAGLLVAAKPLSLDQHVREDDHGLALPVLTKELGGAAIPRQHLAKVRNRRAGEGIERVENAAQLGVEVGLKVASGISQGRAPR